VRNRSLLLIVFFSLLAAAAPSFADDVSSDAKAAAQAMVERFADSWNRADGKAYGENYWPEAELVNPSGAIVDGQAAIVQEHVDLWSGIFKGSHAVGRVRKIRMLGPNSMMVDFDVEVSNVGHLPPGSPMYSDGILRNHLKHILEKRIGQWKVIAAQNTFIAPPRQQ
jgi:uncharacterized protein (TIGR02246 family)